MPWIFFETGLHRRDYQTRSIYERTIQPGHTVLWCSLAHARAWPLFECRCTEFNCIVHNIGSPAFSAIGACAIKAHLYSMHS